MSYIAVASSRNIDKILRRARQRGRELESLYKAHRNTEFSITDLSLLVKESARQLCDALDQTMVLVYERIVQVGSTSGRGVIYFPAEENETAVLAKLKRGRMANLGTTHPDLFKLIIQRQAYNNRFYKFVPALRRVSNISHNRLHELVAAEGSMFIMGPVQLVRPPIPEHPNDGMCVPVDIDLHPIAGPIGAAERVVLRLEDLNRDAASYLFESFGNTRRIL